MRGWKGGKVSASKGTGVRVQDDDAGGVCMCVRECVQREDGVEAIEVMERWKKKTQWKRSCNYGVEEETKKTVMAERQTRFRPGKGGRTW